MDAGAFMQENKRWLIGCGIGALVWLIGGMVVDAVFNTANAAKSPKQLGAPSTKVYDQAALQAARQEGEQLTAALQQLRLGNGFVQSDKYLLANHGKPDEYQYQIGRELRKAIATAADDREVQVTESGIAWEVSPNPDDIKSVLFGLELLDEVQQRLFAAHDAVRKASEDVPGLRAILALKVDARRGSRTPVRALRPGEVDPREAFVQEQVSFQFQASEAVALGFLESCLKPGRTLIIDGWQMLKPQKLGDPCTIKATAFGIAFKEGK